MKKRARALHIRYETKYSEHLDHSSGESTPHVVQGLQTKRHVNRNSGNCEKVGNNSINEISSKFARKLVFA